MLPYLVAFGLLAHFLFWGAGLAMLAMPRPWRRFWPVLAAPAGAALQTLVVWASASANLRGTDSYAWMSEAIPVLLLAAGLWRRGLAAVWDAGRFGAVGIATILSLAALVHPLARAAPGLTTASLAGCDAADYAAGARVLKEFARADRGGFSGENEGEQAPSAGNFFDLWLKRNPFAPSALIAFNGTIFHCPPYELTGLLTLVLAAALLPAVFWTARAVLGYRFAASLGISVLFGFSPIVWYAADQVATGQLLAASAVALITWAGVALWRGPLGGRRGGAFFGLLTIAYGLLLGCDPFGVIVCLVPPLAYAGGLALWEGRWRHFARWLLGMLPPLVLSSLVFWNRLAGLTEGFRQFRTHDLGWSTPALSPEGWLGMVTGPGLEPITWLWRLALALAVILALAEVVRRGLARGDCRTYLAACLAVPVLLGYGYLVARGNPLELGADANGSGYKFLAIFYPVLLPALFLWITLGRQSRLGGRIAVMALVVVVAAANLRAVGQFSTRLRAAPLVVDHDLSDLRKIEAMPDVTSINLLLPELPLWPRLWAKAFLLRKRQNFAPETGEGRRQAPLVGEWDLEDELVTLRLPAGGSRRINSEYSLVEVASPYYLRANLNDGWYDLERLPHTSVRWRWSAETAALRLENPQDRPLRLTLIFDGASLRERELQLWSRGRRLAVTRVGTRRAVVRTSDFAIPPGVTRLELRSDLPPTPGPSGDDRLLGFIAFGITLEAHGESGEFEP